ncbi:MAG: TM0106 family RecB-like putative nuclease [Gemmatimonadales bacterium]
MRPDGQGVLFSPKDLLVYAEGDFAAWMERAKFEGVTDLAPDAEDEELKLLITQGTAHEEAVLALERASGRGIVELKGSGEGDATASTIVALREGKATIYQACLRRDNIRGYSDFLRRVDRPSGLGAHSYEPWDTKLAKTVRPYHVIQLCAYCDALEEMQGVLPERFGFILGDGREESFRTLDYLHYYRALRDRFLVFEAAWTKAARPDPALDRSWGRWTTAAEGILEARDHLSRVAGVSRSQIQRLESAGITTMTALASAPARPITIDKMVYAKLTRQARLQLGSVGRDTPLFEIPNPQVDAKPAGLQLLPPPSKGDVYFDMEGFPHVEGGLEYLFGAAVGTGKKWEFHDWWAHDTAAERVAFERFIDWVVARRAKDQAMHVYHYAAYETTALKRLMGKFGTREQEVDDLLRGQVFVDLYAVVRQGVAVGTPSYSLKDVEHLYRPRRAGEVTTAGGSVIAYDHWRESGESEDWKRSPKLKAIRDYNEDDCVSTGQLTEWLRARQVEHQIAYVPPEAREPENGEEEKGEHPTDQLIHELEARGGDGSSERLLAGLLNYHRREAKPTWWQLFNWQSMTDEELIEESDPLGFLTRTDTPSKQIKRSTAWEFTFPSQEFAIEAGKSVRVSADLAAITVEELDAASGRVWLKRGSASGEPGQVLSILPYDLISTAKIEESLQRYARSVIAEGWPATGVSSLLHKQAPKAAEGGSVRAEGEEIVAAATRVARGLNGEVLCLQGPPGAGKTYTAAHLIAALLADGKRVGVTGQAHKVIDKVLIDTAVVLQKAGHSAPILKFGGEPKEGEVVPFQRASDKVVTSTLATKGACLIGGTAWFFSREDLAGVFDVLVVDEAGQYPLANAVAAGQAARSLILVGDQMQLAQPRKGTHPGSSGSSALEYYLDGHQTVPPSLGILLDRTWRLHPEICGFISDAFYEGRLQGVAGLDAQRLGPAKPGATVSATCGIALVDVPHVGNASWSAEEIAAIKELTRELVGREWTDSKNVRKTLTPPDILVVAPFNDQVGRLEAALGPDFRVGTVDRFQGQEAPVVIVSLTSSTLEDAPRGAEFLLSPNRINVAISRAKCLAIVVGSPALERVRPTTVKQMALVNRLSWLRALP